ncbi:MAG: glycosyltransferase family 39 protein [Phycisphaerales bacterium]|nr:MAG: glycosyltransferase family 39 protein [Phycisphaerales bacterium]
MHARLGSIRDRFCFRGGAAWWRNPAAGGLLLLWCLVIYLPGLSALPVIDRDEARFAQASRQMFESVALPSDQRVEALHRGGLVVPMIGERDRLNKPPLVYWLQAGSAAIWTRGDPARDAIWMYRVPSVLGAMVAVLATWWLGVRVFDPRAGALGAAMLAVAPMVVWDSRQARADQLLLACTTVAMAALWVVWRRSSRGERVPMLALGTLWVAIGLGVLAKGPIAPMVVVLAVVAIGVLTRSWAWIARLRPLMGLVILGAMVLPWVLAVAAQVGFGNYFEIVFDEVLGRSAAPKEGHWGPPGYHFVLLMALFWPGVIVTGLGLVRAVRRGVRTPRVAGGLGVVSRLRGVWYRWRRRLAGRKGELFCLAWLVPSWVVFELVSTKLPHYTMPLYPAVALLTARGLLAAQAGSIASAFGKPARLGYRLWVVLGWVLLGMAAVGAIWSVRLGGLQALAGVAAAAACAGAAYALWRTIDDADDGRFVRTQGVGLLAGLIFAVTVTVAGVPGVVRLTDRLEGVITQADPAGVRPVASVQYHEDSLVFATRGRLVRLNEPDVAQWRRAHRDGVLIVPERLAPALVADGMTRFGGATGFNYSRGRRESLAVLTDRP